MPSKRNLQISQERGQGERSRRHAVLRCASVCYAGFIAGLWPYGQGQQPLWGVGRLRLSFLGFAEPRLDKCNDLRLLLFPQKLAQILAERGKTPGYD